MESVLKYQRKRPLDRRNVVDRYDARLTIARKTTRTVDSLSKKVSRDIINKTLKMAEELISSR